MLSIGEVAYLRTHNTGGVDLVTHSTGEGVSLITWRKNGSHNTGLAGSAEGTESTSYEP